MTSSILLGVGDEVSTEKIGFRTVRQEVGYDAEQSIHILRLFVSNGFYPVSADTLVKGLDFAGSSGQIQAMVELYASREVVDGLDLAAGERAGRRQASIGTLTVDKNPAGSALVRAAAGFGTFQAHQLRSM